MRSIITSCICLSLAVLPLGSFAKQVDARPEQGAVRQKTDRSQALDPFSFALAVIGPDVSAVKGKSLQSQKAPQSLKTLQSLKNLNAQAPAASKVLGGAPQLKSQSSFACDTARSQAILQKLRRQYGAETSIRGRSHVWDVKNPNANRRQADIVTIIFQRDNGQCRLLLDRDRGADGRKTWALPRLNTNTERKIHKTNKSAPVNPRKKILKEPQL